MLVVKIVSTTIIALISMILLASALIAKNRKTSITVAMLILTYLLAILCMWG